MSKEILNALKCLKHGEKVFTDISTQMVDAEQAEHFKKFATYYKAVGAQLSQSSLKSVSPKAGRVWRYEEKDEFQKKEQPPLLIHLHIEKTAGSTFYSILRKTYYRLYTIGTHDVSDWITPDILYNMVSETPFARAITGHLSFKNDIYRILDDHYFNITMLRNPIERVLSFYYWKGHDKKYKSIIDFLEEERDVLVDNGQVRKMTEKGMDYAYGELPETLLAEATENLMNKITCFGLTEDFDASLLLFTDLFGWQDILYTRRKVISKRPQAADLSKEEREKIISYNRLDMALYEKAKAIFATRVAGLGDDFQGRVKKFQEMNQDMQDNQNTLSHGVLQDHPWTKRYQE
ncbi:MAG: sulfotransferase family 2 domain-containing protein [Alphaproteobacteria bacterium]